MDFPDNWRVLVLIGSVLPIYWLLNAVYWKATGAQREERRRQDQLLVEQRLREQQEAEIRRHVDQLRWLRLIAAEEFHLAQSMREFPPEVLVSAASPLEFERLIGLLLEADGWEVRLTGLGADEGVDAFWGKSGADIGVVQVKHRPKSRVGRPILQQIIGVAASRGLSEVLIATSGEFADTVRQYKPRKGIRVTLWNRDVILRKISRLPVVQRVRIPREMPTAAAAVASRRGRSDAIVAGAPPPPECHGTCELHEMHDGDYEWVCTAFPDCDFRVEADPRLRLVIDEGAYPVVRWRWASIMDTAAYRDATPSEVLRRLKGNELRRSGPARSRRWSRGRYRR